MRPSDESEEIQRDDLADNVLPLRRDASQKRLSPPRQVAPRETEPREYSHLEDFGESAAETTERGDEVRAMAAARLKKARRGRAPRALRHSLFLCGAMVVWLLLVAYSLDNYRQYRVFQNLVDARQVQLTALQSQLRAGQQKLAFMQMPQGREQILMEHGYLRSGDRILLFPETENDAAQTAAPTSAAPIAAAPTPVITPQSGAPQNGSAWRRAAQTVGSWYQTLREAAGDSPTSP